MRAHNHGVRGDSVFCLLQYACLKLSKPGLASRPWHRLPPFPCQCQLQLGAVPTASARLGLACGDASSTLFSIFSSGCFSRLSSHLFIIFYLSFFILCPYFLYLFRYVNHAHTSFCIRWFGVKAAVFAHVLYQHFRLPLASRPHAHLY